MSKFNSTAFSSTVAPSIQAHRMEGLKPCSRCRAAGGYPSAPPFSLSVGAKNAGRLFRGILLFMIPVLPLSADLPVWWSNAVTQIVDDPEIPVFVEGNHSPANLGQLKHVASMAWLYLDRTLPNGAGFNITDSWQEIPLEENYAPINVGQLKAVAKPFYDRLHAEVNNTWTHLSHIGYDPIQNLIDRGYPSGWTHDYPWDPNDPVAENYAPANVGQLKMAFSFEVPEITEEPFFTATCQQSPVGILLEWGNPVWGDYVSDWYIERATHPQGPFSQIWSLYEGANPQQVHRSFLDTSPPYPWANGQGLQTCKETAILITLSGSSPNQSPLTFSIDNPPDPLHGSLGTITPISNNSAEVWFTPAPGFCGQTSFTFKVNSGFWPSEDYFYRIRYSYYDSGQWRQSHYSNIASPTGDCNGTALDSQPATVSINVGDPNLYAICQDVMTGKGEPISITLSGSDACGDDLTFTVTQGPEYGVLGTITPISGTSATVTYTPNSGFDGIDTFWFTADSCGFSSSWRLATIRVVPGPELIVECFPRTIRLKWTLPEWMQYGVNNSFNIYRCSTSSGTCEPTTLYATIDDNAILSDPNLWEFLDMDVQEGTTYCYRVTFTRQSTCDSQTVYESPSSNTECATVCCPDSPGNDLWTDYGPTPQELAEWIVGPGFTVSNASYTGAPVAKGIFGNGFGADFLIDTGVILSTGDIALAKGPNDESDAELRHAGPRDSDLDTLLGSAVTEDAAIIEFDVSSATATTLTFEYIFASEEYPEFVGSEYNDLVAIFVDDGVNNVNIATVPHPTLPNESTYVGVNTVNGGKVNPEGDIPAANPAYYVDNHDPDPANKSLPAHAALAPVYNIQYDGTTKLLSAQTNMAANVTYSIKIAIADASDDMLDSAVFIKAQIPCP